MRPDCNDLLRWSTLLRDDLAEIKADLDDPGLTRRGFEFLELRVKWLARDLVALRALVAPASTISSFEC